MKPMLLCRENPDTSKLQYPMLVFPKLDGIRCPIVDAKAKSRTLKDIPNKHVQSILSYPEFEGFDGELIVGEPNSPTVYRDTNSFVMSHDKVGMFRYFVFDYWNRDEPFYKRFQALSESLVHEYIEVIKGVLVNNEEELLEAERQVLDAGYEGLILRSLTGKYKFGRTTMNENNTYKLKRFEDAEAVIVGFEEEMHNGNDAETNELGRTKRSTAKAGMSGKGTLGAFICKTPDGIEFRIGSGFDAEMRKQYWNDKISLLGGTVKYKHFPIGVKDKPRHPIFLGFRDMEIDG
jgi:DNA ligase-1